MKLHYLYFCEGNLSSGVTKKVISQIKALINTGLQCKLLLASTENIDIPDIIEHQFHKTSLINNKIDTYHDLKQKASILRNIIQQLDKNDILYIRGIPANPWTLKSFKEKRQCKIVCEIQSKSLNEQPICLSSILERITTKAVRKTIDAFVAVTDEIRDYETNIFPAATNSITIPNGIDISEIPVKSSKHINRKLRLLCVARFNIHHGIDRILPLIKKDRTNIHLELAGVGPCLNALKEKATKMGIEKNITFSGALSGKQLDDSFNRNDVAIGALALHRLGLKECASLKHREYCARGIPFIYAGNDPDFPSNFPYAKQLPLNDQTISSKTIIEFANCIIAQPLHSQKMHEFAQANLSWTSKMGKLKKFLEEL